MVFACLRGAVWNTANVPDLITAFVDRGRQRLATCELLPLDKVPAVKSNKKKERSSSSQLKDEHLIAIPEALASRTSK
jgi:hypothetical protein